MTDAVSRIRAALSEARQAQAVAEAGQAKAKAECDLLKSQLAAALAQLAEARVGTPRGVQIGFHTLRA